MKYKNLVIFALLMLFGVIAVATDLEKLRNQAQKQKQQGNYLVAENIYLQILKSQYGYSSLA